MRRYVEDLNLQNGDCEYNLVLGVAALTLTFTGPGSLSLDALLGHAIYSDTAS